MRYRECLAMAERMLGPWIAMSPKGTSFGASLAPTSAGRQTKTQPAEYRSE